VLLEYKLLNFGGSSDQKTIVSSNDRLNTTGSIYHITPSGRILLSSQA